MYLILLNNKILKDMVLQMMHLINSKSQVGILLDNQYLLYNSSLLDRAQVQLLLRLGNNIPRHINSKQQLLIKH